MQFFSRVFRTQGIWLFRWRSYLPIVLVGFVVAGMVDSKYIAANPEASPLWELLCFAVSFAGLLLRAWVIGYTPRGTSGRGSVIKAEELNTTGPYSIMRHPLYVGNYLCWLGISMFTRLWWMPVLFSLCFVVIYERIIAAEEGFLEGKFGDKFRLWASKTPMFIPRLKGWRPPSVSFSLVKVVRKEHSTWLAVTSSFLFVEIVEDIMFESGIHVDVFWILAFLSCVFVSFYVKILKRRVFTFSS